MVSPSSVLTCAHVVNAAFGRGEWTQTPPSASTVRVKLPNLGAGILTEARVSAWIPPRSHRGGCVRDGEISWRGDLAVLELVRPLALPVMVPAWTGLREDQRLRARSFDGGAAATVGVIVRSTGPHESYVDPDERPGPGIVPGYSGGPLWCPGLAAVAGLVCGQLQDQEGTDTGFSRRGFVLSSQQIYAEFEDALGAVSASALVGALQPLPAEPPTARTVQRLHLRRLIERSMPGDEQRMRQARRLCRECALPPGPAGAPPTPDEFVAVMLGHPGAAATLVEGLDAEGCGEVTPLLEAGLRFPAPGLLSAGERRLLDELLEQLVSLGAITPDDFDEAAQDARPGARPDPALRCSAGAPDFAVLRRRWSVRHLEGFTGARADQPRGVPPLLRFVEHLAAFATTSAATDDDTQALVEMLCTWSTDVARRLRLSPEALQEHRNAAAESAEQRRSEQDARTHGRIVVCVARYRHGRRQGRYRLSMWTDLGRGRLTQLPSPGDQPLTPSQAGRLIREAVALYRRDGDRVVEVFLDETELALDVDEWDSAAPESTLPEPLGAAVPVAVRVLTYLGQTQELERQQSFDIRWRQADLGELVDISAKCTTENHVRSVVWASPQAARALLRTADPGMRGTLAAVCLRLGVPFVLWDRRAEDTVAADHFDGLAPQQPVTGLAERVRRYRAALMGFPEEHPARPVLALEDPRLPPPPRLTLRDPARSGVSDKATAATSGGTADQGDHL